MKAVRFELWPHLIKLIQLIDTDRFIIVMKARQLGITSLLTAYAYWKAKFHEHAKVLMMSQGEMEAYDLIAKCVFIDSKLPEEMQSNRNPDSASCIGFPELSSEIRALPSTEKAGRSTDASLVICDEWEYHPYAEQSFAAIKPAIDAGGQFIGVSTVDRARLNTFFKTIYRGSMSNSNNFKRLFMGWFERPGRTQEWFESTSRDYPEWRRKGEYPSTEEEALSVEKIRQYFDSDAMAQMPKLEPIPCELSDKYKGIVKIYKLPVVGNKYCLFTDPSDGKEDPHATVVRDHRTGEWVAVSNGKTSADECARIHDDLVRFYNNAWNSFEQNSRAGGMFESKIKELAPPNQCPRVEANKTLNTKGVIGWWTGKTLRNEMLLNMEENIRLRLDIIYSREVIQELKNFVTPEGGEPQAAPGAHDDFVIAGGGVIQIDKYMPLSAGQVRSSRIRERW